MNPWFRSAVPVRISKALRLLAATTLAVGATISHLHAQSTVPPLPPSVMYVLPVQSISDAAFATEVASLRARLGEGPLARVGFTFFIFVPMTSWTVNTTDPAALRAALASTIGQIDRAVQLGVANNIPIGLSIITSIRGRNDGAKTAAVIEDRRNIEWYTTRLNGLMLLPDGALGATLR